MFLRARLLLAGDIMDRSLADRKLAGGISLEWRGEIVHAPHAPHAVGSPGPDLRTRDDIKAQIVLPHAGAFPGPELRSEIHNAGYVHNGPHLGRYCIPTERGFLLNDRAALVDGGAAHCSGGMCCGDAHCSGGTVQQEYETVEGSEERAGCSREGQQAQRGDPDRQRTARQVT